MRAIAAGATEDELVVVATGALTTLYHLLAQLAARRLLEVSVEFDGEVLCCLLPRSRDFHLPGEIEMPRRIVLDRFAYLRAGRRGAVLQSPDACCDIVAESATFSALIPGLPPRLSIATTCNVMSSDRCSRCWSRWALPATPMRLNPRPGGSGNSMTACFTLQANCMTTASRAARPIDSATAWRLRRRSGPAITAPKSPCRPWSKV